MKNLSIFFKCSLSSLQFAIPPLLTILLGKYLFETLVFDFPQMNHHLKNSLPVNNTPPSLLELKARLLWLSSVLIYIFINLGFISFLWRILRKHKYSEILALLLITACMVAVDLNYLLSANPENSPLLNIFHFTFDTMTASGLLSQAKLSMVKTILNIINFIALVIIPLSAITGCCIVKQNPENISQVNRQFSLLKDFIKGASAIMVVGIVHMQLWLSWPLSLSLELPDINNIKNVIATIIQYWGICYSLTIAAFYLPIAAHLRKKAYELSDTPSLIDNAENPKHSLTTHSLYQSTTSQLPQIVAILCPMLVGSISPTLTNFISI